MKKIKVHYHVNVVCLCETRTCRCAHSWTEENVTKYTLYLISVWSFWVCHKNKALTLIYFGKYLEKCNYC